MSLEPKKLTLPPVGLPPEIEAALNDIVNEEFTRERDAGRLEGLREGFCAVLGDALGGAVFLVLTSPTPPSNAAFAGLSRAVVGKWVSRVRQNVGLGLECPTKAHRRGTRARNRGNVDKSPVT